MRVSQFRKLIREEVRKVLKEQLNPNDTYVVDVGSSRGDFDPARIQKVSGDVRTVAIEELKNATNDAGDPEFAEEFIRAFKLDQDTYYILTGEESVTVVGKPISKKYGNFWTMLASKDFDGAAKIFDRMDADSVKSPEVSGTSGRK
jgi:hypothetical protein